MHRNPETLTTLGSSGTKLLLPSWLLRFSRRVERDTISTMLTVPSDPTTRGASRRPNWPGHAQVRKSTRLVEVQFLTHCLFFFHKSPKILSASLPDMTSFTSPIPFPILGFYYDICDCHILPVQEWTPVLNVCPNPCTKPNSCNPN